MNCEICLTANQHMAVTDPDFGREYKVCFTCANKTGQLSDADYKAEMDAMFARLVH